MSTGYMKGQIHSGTKEIRVVVPAVMHSDAEAKIKRLYGVSQVWNIAECDKDGNSVGMFGGLGGGMDVGSTGSLIILGGGLLAFFTLTPFIMSALLGAAGTWGAGKATNYSLQKYADTKNPSDNESKKALTILVSAVVLGTIGFGWGSNIKKGFDAPTTSSVEFVRNA